jgi:hypothetical protein
MYPDRLVVNAGVELFELAYEDIDHLQINPIQVNIEHHRADVIKDITINGILAARRIRQTIERHGLPINLDRSPTAPPTPLNVALSRVRAGRGTLTTIGHVKRVAKGRSVVSGRFNRSGDPGFPWDPGLTARAGSAMITQV